MAITLRLKYNGNTYNFINSGVYKGVTYYPRAPLVTVAEVFNDLKNGSDINGISRRDVEETCTLKLSGSASDVLDAVRDVELALAMADQDTVRIEYAATGDVYRSQIFWGTVDWSDDAALRNLQKTTVTVMVNIRWRRQWFWEHATQQQLTLDSVYTTGNTSVETRNWLNSWVNIQSGDVEGVLPPPARIRIENTYGETRTWRWIWMTNNVWNDPANFVPTLNMAQSDSWTGSSSHTTDRMQYSFSNSQCLDMAGDYFRVLWHGFVPDNSYLQAHVAIVNGSLYARRIDGPEIFAGNNFQVLDLGVFPLPPGKATGHTGLTISVRYGGSGSITTDGIALLPVKNSRRLHMTAYDVDDGQGVEDDGITGEHFFFDASNVHAPYTNAYEQPIYLIPGREQKLWTIIGETAVEFDTALHRTIQIWYRPRRLTM